jgi:hypothetical protein
VNSSREKIVSRFLLAFCAVAILVSGASGQRTRQEFSMYAGTGHYLGDIGGAGIESRGFVFDLQPQATRTSVGAAYAWGLNRTIWLEVGGQVVNLYGDDAFTGAGPRRARNLHFRNTLIEGSTRVRWEVWSGPNFQSPDKIYPSIFVVGGIGVFYHNPMTRLRTNADNGAAWYSLRALQTEGVSYSPLALSLPVGFGMSWDLGAGWKVSWELNYRFTTTDYLDDVSGNYGNPEEMSELALQLSWQADLFSMQSAYDDWAESQSIHFPYGEQGGGIRGNPDAKDGFGSLQVRFAKEITKRGSTRGHSRPMRQQNRRLKRSRSGPRR